MAAYRVLSGEDRECRAYVARFAAETLPFRQLRGGALTLDDAVIRGLKADAGKLARKRWRPRMSCPWWKAT